MNVERLAKLIGKSMNFENIIGTINNGSAGAADINAHLSYCGLSNEEQELINVMLTGDLSYGKNIYDTWGLIILTEYLTACHEVFYQPSKDRYSKVTDKVVDCLFIETLNTHCPFCNGTGKIIIENQISTCPHCDDGTFIFNDKIRQEMMDISNLEYDIVKKFYADVSNNLYNDYMTAVEKLRKHE
tara:strand:- start:1107 stop:1664 length:558 start_codon:yes stop_codon:yes gene_type:complete